MQRQSMSPVGCPQELRFGESALGELPGLIQILGARKFFFVVDEIASA